MMVHFFSTFFIILQLKMYNLEHCIWKCHSFSIHHFSLNCGHFPAFFSSWPGVWKVEHFFMISHDITQEITLPKLVSLTWSFSFLVFSLCFWSFLVPKMNCGQTAFMTTWNHKSEEALTWGLSFHVIFEADVWKCNH